VAKFVFAHPTRPIGAPFRLGYYTSIDHMSRKTPPREALIAYYRVSTAEQGSSRLGLEAQREAVHIYAAQCGLAIAAEFEEVLSTRKDRPEFEAALRMCEQFGHTLAVARLDRLSRDLLTIAQLQKSGVDFVAVDMPGASKFMVQILAAVAENERDMISERTKAALARAKANGKQLGAPDPLANIAASHQSQAQQAEDFRKQYRSEILDMRQRGMTFQKIADHFTAAGIPTPAGSTKWNPAHVHRMLKRPASLPLADLPDGHDQVANDDELPLFPVDLAQ